MESKRLGRGEVVLLDSSVLIWTLVDPGKLGLRFRQRIEKLGWAYYSPLSTFELNLAHLSGKAPQLPEDFTNKLSNLALAELPYSQAASDASKELSQLFRSDPFDWMLLSQAIAVDCDFFTSDQRLLALGLDFVKDATR